MGSVPSEDTVDYEKLRDKELAALFLIDPENQEIRERFAARCLQLLKFMTRGYANNPEICPMSSVHPDTFAPDVLCRAQLKFAKGISQLEQPEALYGWLKEIARTAALEERDKIISRGIVKRVFVSTTEPDDEEDANGAVPILDDKNHREARDRYCSKHYPDATQMLLARERKEILRAALGIHAAQGTRRDAECVYWIATKMKQDPSVEEIARQRGTTKDDVFHLLSHDYKALGKIIKEVFHLEPKDLKT